MRKLVLFLLLVFAVSLVIPSGVVLAADPPGVPADLAVSGSTATTISLSWTVGENATETMIRIKTTAFTGDATAVTEGTLVYKGTDDNCTAVGLTKGTTYYFRAWSWMD